MRCLKSFIRLLSKKGKKREKEGKPTTNKSEMPSLYQTLSTSIVWVGSVLWITPAIAVLQPERCKASWTAWINFQTNTPKWECVLLRWVWSQECTGWFPLCFHFRWLKSLSGCRVMYSTLIVPACGCSAFSAVFELLDTWVETPHHLHHFLSEYQDIKKWQPHDSTSDRIHFKIFRFYRLCYR